MVPTMLRVVFLLLSVTFFSTWLVEAFIPGGTSDAKNSRLHMAPRFDPKEQRWSPTRPEEEPSAGYSPVKSLLLHGPKPFFQRIFTPDQYEQAVLKFMAGDKCSREEAQGNMDAYFANSNDWAYNRFQAERTGFKPDYVTLKPKKLVLTLTWAAFVFASIGRAAYALNAGEKFYDFL